MNYEYFRRDMHRAFYIGIETDRFRNPATGERSHVNYFRVLRRMKLAKNRSEVSTFYFDDLFAEAFAQDISSAWIGNTVLTLIDR